jgi:hypothetical protein
MESLHPQDDDEIDIEVQQEAENEYYITGGKYLGRILRCKYPFHLGYGVYHSSTQDEDWEVVGDLPLAPEQKHFYIEKIREFRIEALKQTVEQNRHHGYELHEEPGDIFIVTQDDNGNP